MERKYDLKLENGKVVQWTGESPEDAAFRYVDCIRPGVAVVATRPASDPGVSILGRSTIIG